MQPPLMTQKLQRCDLCAYEGTQTDHIGQCPRCHWDELRPIEAGPSTGPGRAKETDMQTPSLGRTVIVRNHGLGTGDAPAVITRIWGPKCVNLQVLPDCNAPTCKTSVPLFQTEDEAADYLAGMVGHTPIVAFWPTRA